MGKKGGLIRGYVGKRVLGYLENGGKVLFALGFILVS